MARKEAGSLHSGVSSHQSRASGTLVCGNIGSEVQVLLLCGSFAIDFNTARIPPGF